MTNILKEDNGGGLQIERYDDNCNIVSVVTGLEYSNSFNLKEFCEYGITWDYSDVGGQISGYYVDGNTDGAMDDKGTEMDANSAIDDSEWTETIVVSVDGVLTEVNSDRMGQAGTDVMIRSK